MGPKTEEKGWESTRGGSEDSGGMEMGPCCTACAPGADHCAFMGASGPGEFTNDEIAVGKRVCGSLQSGCLGVIQQTDCHSIRSLQAACHAHYTVVPQAAAAVQLVPRDVSPPQPHPPLRRWRKTLHAYRRWLYPRAWC